MTKAKARELLALSVGSLPSQLSPTDRVKPGGLLLQMLAVVCSPERTSGLVSCAFLLLEPSVFLFEYITSFQSALLPLRF